MMLVDDVALGDGGAVEMPDDSPLMEITSLHLMTLMVMALGP